MSPENKTAKQSLSTTTPRIAWLIWFVAALFYAIEFFQRVAPTVLALPLSRAFTISPIELGLIMSLYYYVYAVAQLPVGFILDHYSPRLVMSLAATVVSLGTLLFAYAHFVWALALGRILIGFGSAFGFIGCLKIARDWFSDERFALIVGLTNTLGVIGALFGEEPLARLNTHIGWQNSLVVTAIAGLIIAALIAVVVRNNPSTIHNDDEHAESSKQQRQWPIKTSLMTILKSRQAWLIALYAGLMVSPVIAFAELWSVAYLTKVQQLSASLAAEINSFIFIGIAIGGPINGYLCGITPKRKTIMVLGNIIALALFLVIIFAPALPVALMALVMFGFGFSVSSMLVCFTLNTESHDRHIGATILAFTNMFIMIVGAIFQPLIGLILENMGGITKLSDATAPDLRGSLIVLALALGIALLIVRFIQKPQKK